MAKRVQKPKGFQIHGIDDVYSVSDCVNEDFADYIKYWKHNGYWLFDSPRDHSERWRRKTPFNLTERPSSTTKCTARSSMARFGPRTKPNPHFQPTSFRRRKNCSKVSMWSRFMRGMRLTFSPLSCNGLARGIRTNPHCLLESFAEAYDQLNGGAFNNAEPGPYRIFAVYSVAWPHNPIRWLGDSKRVSNRHLAVHNLTVLQVFRIKRGAVRFESGRGDQRVIDTDIRTVAQSSTRLHAYPV